MSFIIRLPSRYRDILVLIPETSMGAQTLDVVLRDGTIIPDVVIFNGEEARSNSNFNPNAVVAFKDRSGNEWRLDS